MAVSERLKAFLDASKASYTAARHPTAYTAQEIAAAQHIPGRQLAKCVLMKTDRGPLLAVLPAIALIDLKRLKAQFGVKTLAIANEADIKERFPDVEVGAMSPFGNLYEVPVVMDCALEAAEEIAFNAGSHTDTIRMRARDVAALIKPTVCAFSQPIQSKRPAKQKHKPRRKASAATRLKPKRSTARRPVSKSRNKRPTRRR